MAGMHPLEPFSPWLGVSYYHAQVSPCLRPCTAKNCELAFGTLDGKSPPLQPTSSSGPLQGYTASPYNYSPTNTQNPSSSSSTTSPLPSTAAAGSAPGDKPTGPSGSIIGFAIVGVVLGLVIVGLLAFWYRRTRQRRTQPTIGTSIPEVAGLRGLLFSRQYRLPRFARRRQVRPICRGSPLHTAFLPSHSGHGI